ncbi:MAG TPA: glycosyltransferase family 2 protein [Candidatus Acidoferrales bacterium]|nr:glycosyltransferase family 2 protein [Candidatus Acidoferrales bacterium]
MQFLTPHLALAALLAAVACLWLVVTTRTWLGIDRLPRLADAAPLPDEALPFVSLLVSARDEAEKMPAALRSMLALDYPAYEVISVDDRSTDATPQILRESSAACKHLRAIRVDALPPGWLGKPHGLQTAYENSRGEWLVFTDADVRFHPDVLRRAVSLAIERRWDHLTLFPQMEMAGFWEKTLLTYFSLGGFLYSRAWKIPERDSSAYAGVGAFQLLRRSAYEAVGTHRRLALEVVDDMKLGKIVKDGGYVSCVALPGDLLGLRWYSGAANIIRGTEKNFFAAAGFSLGRAMGQIGFVLLASVLPFLALPFAGGWARWFAGIAAAAAALLHARVAHVVRASPLYGLTHPLGALLVCFMSARSAAVTLWQKGIYWRGTFYPLDQLRRGSV